jgi:hypothetical protein
MVVELATILLGAAAAVALVLYAAPRGYFGHPRKQAISTVVAKPATTYTPKAETFTQVKEAQAPKAAEPAPSPEPTPAPATAPAIYETVQPATNPALPPPPAAGSSAVTFGASATPQRATRTYRRKTAPTRSSVGRSPPRRERKH